MSPPRSRFYRNNRPFPSLATAPRPRQRSRMPLSVALGAVVCGCSVGPPDLRDAFPAIGAGPGLSDGRSGDGTPGVAPGAPGGPGAPGDPGSPGGPDASRPPVPTPPPPKPAVPPKKPPDYIAPPPDSAPEPVPLKPPVTATPKPRFPGYPYPIGSGNSEFLYEQAARVLELSNQARSDAGLRPLAGDAALDKLARSRSEDMAVRNYFSHDTPDGTNLFDMLRQLGIPYRSAGENIAMNTAGSLQTATVAFDGWMNSSGHKANILRTTFGKLGVGVYRSNSGKTYLTQVFTD